MVNSFGNCNTLSQNHTPLLTRDSIPCIPLSAQQTTMETTKEPTGQIHAAMIAVMKAVKSIGKEKTNQQQGFKYRGIDDVYAALHNCFADAGIYCRTEMISREQSERTSAKGNVLFSVVCRVRFHLCAADGSSIPIEIIGEAMDSADKATNKALSISHKYALLQAFMIPTEDMADPDADSPAPAPSGATQQAPAPKPTQKPAAPAPKQHNAPPVVIGITTFDTYIIDSKEVTGTSGKGPWTLWVFTLANGIECKTFNQGIAQQALALVDDQARNHVQVEVGPGRKEGSVELLSVMPADDIPT